ncbi:flagellar biosynthetic protein FliR [Paenibacillus sp.]|uniref:flagellar biosynthetic protein FliR n=1 Tax=Paenibacillus sp. TaxID=58172 RepID=UPI002D49285D|nr:flagellar biosynthetic protein FliR [Paenibacillus sp.]HZG57875.1 flagellar biosynthetic protein FliR [Paenibacillus sp.]
MDLVLAYYPNLLLIFCRMTGFFITAPVFSTRNNVPPPFRIGISVFAALLVFFASGTERAIPIDQEYAYYIIRESLIGVLLGFIAYLFFTVVQIAGSFIDMQMGFGIANVIDPMTGAQSPVFGSFKYMIAMLLFLTLDGHHYLLLGIMDSYQVIPLDNTFFAAVAAGPPVELLTRSVSTAFTLSFQMAAPIVATMFLVDVALGILAKTAPQFNVFVVGMPLKILVGLGVMLLLIPGFAFLFQNLFATMFENMNEMMRALRTA